MLTTISTASFLIAMLAVQTAFAADAQSYPTKPVRMVIGFAAGGIPALRTNYLLVKNIEVSGLQITDYRKRRPGELHTAYSEIFGYYALGLVKPAPVVPFALDDAGTALAAIRDRGIEGRAVLRLRDD